MAAQILIKTGAHVRVSVRRALAGKNLESLQKTVRQEFLRHDEQEQDMRSVMAGLEIGFMRRLGQFRHE